MDFIFTGFDKGRKKASGALVVLAQGAPKLGPRATEIDAASAGSLNRALKASRFKGEIGEFIEILAPANLGYNRVLIAGAGTELGQRHCEQLGGQLCARLNLSGETELHILLDETVGKPAADIAAAIASGIALRRYRFDKYRTTETADKKPSLKHCTILCDDPKGAQAIHARMAKVIDGVYFTRDLVSEPANVIFPKSFAAQLKELSELGIKVEILGQKEMRGLNMNALLGVAQGSVHEPQLVVMHWEGGGKNAKAKPLALVGKGVTFDSGGISIKPSAGMEQMKWDMGGAGAVAGAMKAIASRKARANVIGVVALVENMPSGSAQRPGDVVKSMSGQTIEVINTDAEGRLILADALTFTQQRYSPRLIVDLATLTGAMIVSLGHEYAGLFANDDKLAQALLQAGEDSGDLLWRMPMNPAYDQLINTPIADVKNSGAREAGSITAAHFLQRFVTKGTPWAHLDIAGMVWSEKDKPLFEKGATGYGVRLLDRFVAMEEEGAL